MIVHRFMSNKEYQRLMAGKTLTNTTKHAEVGKKSTSIGFCFFTEKPEDAVHWLSFVADSLDWCVTLDIPEHLLHKSKGCYRDHERDSIEYHATIWRTEWCLREYSLADVRVMAATDQWKNYEEDMKLKLVKELGPLGRLLLMMICPSKNTTKQ